MVEAGGDPAGATPLTTDDMQGLKLPHVTTRAQLDEVEQANVAQGLRWLAQIRVGGILDDAFLRRLHTRLFGDVWEWAGTYRERETNIGVAPNRIATQVRLLLDNAPDPGCAGTAVHTARNGVRDIICRVGCGGWEP